MSKSIKLCSIEGCVTKHYARGWCKSHYNRYAPIKRQSDQDEHSRLCTISGCSRKHRANGMCHAHYKRLKKTGSIHRDKDIPFGERFWSRVKKSEGCWEWVRGKTTAGYGVVNRDGVQLYAHRVSYELVKGPIPEGHQVDHICLNKSCVNPAHLRPATQKQNLEHLKGARRTSKSGVRGVFWHKGQEQWAASVGHNNRRYHVGYFDDIDEADKAVRARRVELFTHYIDAPEVTA